MSRQFPLHFREYLPTGAFLVVAAASTLLLPESTQAIPAFARQTGNTCDACHVGGFGPQLTPYGRLFKITGYTQRGGTGWQSLVPFSGMAQGSFSHLGGDLPADAVPEHYGDNNNTTLDQASVFIAGGKDHTGGFIQLTYAGVDRAYEVDNTDLRPFVTTTQLFGNDLTVGLSVNNNPSVQDPYNSSFAWSYPFYTSDLEVGPGAATMMSDAFAGNTLGATVYGWYDDHIYLEAGAYHTQSDWLATRFGVAGGPVSHNLIPYVRGAYEWDWGNNVAWTGATFMHANLDPKLGTGNDSFSDYAIDGGYQFLGDRQSVTVQGIFVHEQQHLAGSTADFNAANNSSLGSRYGLNTINVNASYWYENTYGLTLGWLAGFGKKNPVLYPTGADLGGDFEGFANHSPDYNGFSIEADWNPFGHDGSPLQPWLNLRLGARYTLYTKFNGANSNYDGFGRSASDNDTFLLTAWTIF